METREKRHIVSGAAIARLCGLIGSSRPGAHPGRPPWSPAMILMTNLFAKGTYLHVPWYPRRWLAGCALGRRSVGRRGVLWVMLGWAWHTSGRPFLSFPSSLRGPHSPPHRPTHPCLESAWAPPYEHRLFLIQACQGAWPKQDWCADDLRCEWVARPQELQESRTQGRGMRAPHRCCPICSILPMPMQQRHRLTNDTRARGQINGGARIGLTHAST